MTPKQFAAARNAYSYPAVGLRATTIHRDFPSVTAMEDYFQRLLCSGLMSRVRFGYLNVLYWGHYATKDGVTQAPRAARRVQRALAALVSKRIDESAVHDVVRQARSLICRDRLAEALGTLSELPELGVVFASKVCAFLSPESCGVVDRQIARHYREFGFKTDAKDFVTNTKANRILYEPYCAFLRETAQRLNTYSTQFLWRDERKAPRPWRAVDVERAMYEAA